MVLAWQSYYQGQRPFYFTSRIWTWTSATSQTVIISPTLHATITLSPWIHGTVDLNGADL